ncbi:MAG: hypothetical protein LBK95_07700 [Bifidobacteriaceae bacterium]|jgi:hypothetical protein|nr:hypothetical protein [Bifidobacteriaceae bacterium]
MVRKRKGAGKEPGIKTAVLDWLAGLSVDELRDLVTEAAEKSKWLDQWLIDKAAPFIDQGLVDRDKMAKLAGRVAADLVESVDPYDNQGDYRYDYYDEPEDAVIDTAVLEELKAAVAENPSLAALGVLRIGIRELYEFSVGADYSGDYLREEGYDLLVLHAATANALGTGLTPHERLSFAGDLFDLLLGGPSGPVPVDLTDYREVLDGPAWSFFRDLLEGLPPGKHEEAIALARQELAVLDGDEAAIVTLYGGALNDQREIWDAVGALDRAALTDAADRLAERSFNQFREAARDKGFPRPQRGYWAGVDSWMGERAAAAAAKRGELGKAVELTMELFERHTDQANYAKLRERAEAAGLWQDLAPQVERYFAANSPDSWVRELLAQDRVDEAWEFASEDRKGVWDHTQRDLLEARERTHPAEVVPRFRALAQPFLAQTGRGAYESSGALLVRMKYFSRKAGPDQADKFARYMAELGEMARRRPACLEIWRRLKLIPGK